MTTGDDDTPPAEPKRRRRPIVVSEGMTMTGSLSIGGKTQAITHGSHLSVTLPPSVLEQVENWLKISQKVAAATQPLMAAAATITNVGEAAAALSTLGNTRWLYESVSSAALRALQELDLAVPPNLHDVEDLADVHHVVLHEGIPLAYVPNASLVEKLLAAGDAQERAQLLEDHRSEILDDCTRTCAGITHELARRCDEATDALRAGHPGPAQSHAANVIDSLALEVGTRSQLTDYAQSDYDAETLAGLGDLLVLGPLVKAFASWYPNKGQPPPPHFARHVTAHAAGEPDAFQPRYGLVAVMLATSLVRHFHHP